MSTFTSIFSMHPTLVSIPWRGGGRRGRLHEISISRARSSEIVRDLLEFYVVPNTMCCSRSGPDLRTLCHRNQMKICGPQNPGIPTSLPPAHPHRLLSHTLTTPHPPTSLGARG